MQMISTSEKPKPELTGVCRKSAWKVSEKRDSTSEKAGKSIAGVPQTPHSGIKDQTMREDTK